MLRHAGLERSNQSTDTSHMITADLLLAIALTASSRQQASPSVLAQACADEIQANPEGLKALGCRAGIEHLRFKELKPGDPARDARLEAAVTLYSQIARQHLFLEGRATALATVAEMYLESGRIRESVDMWRAVVAADPEQAFWREGLANALDKAGKPEEAEHVLLDAIALVNEARDVYLALTNMYLARQEPAKATALLTRWARAEPDNLGVHTLLAWYYWERVRTDVSAMPPSDLNALLDDGTLAAERALQISPRDPAGTMFLNSFLRLRAALTSDPNERDALNIRAEAVRRDADDMSTPQPLPKLPRRR